jgi:hypothetical protein
MESDWPLNPFKAFRLVKDFSLKPRVTRRETQILLIQFGYHAGALPFFYDTENDVFISNTKPLAVDSVGNSQLSSQHSRVSVWWRLWREKQCSRKYSLQMSLT